MKNAIITGLLALLTSSIMAQSENKAVEQTIAQFAKAADQSDAEALDKLLDNNFHIAMNRLFGSKTVVVLPKAVYLDKIRAKEFGGDTREVTIEEVLINGNTASAKITYAGANMTFTSLSTLVQDEDGQWKMLSEMPVVKS